MDRWIVYQNVKLQMKIVSVRELVSRVLLIVLVGYGSDSNR